jgi:hypothetical protein
MGNAPPSFGRTRPEPEIPAMPLIPHMGQVGAELVITVNEESLREAGNLIASMVANATIQGFAAGWEHATGEPFRAPTSDGPVASGVDLDKL